MVPKEVEGSRGVLSRVHHVNQKMILIFPGFYSYVKFDFRNISLNSFFD